MDFFGDINVYGLNSKIHLNCNPDKEHPFNGLICNDFVASDVKYGDILYFDLPTAMWSKACSNTNKTLPARGVACHDYISMVMRIPILMFGFFYFEKYIKPTNSQIWLSDTIPGDFGDTQPYILGNYVQTIGTAKNPNIFFFDFCPFYIQLG